MEKAKVTNFGRTRSFPTCIGDVMIPRLKSVRLRNLKAAKEISKWAYTKVEYPEGDSRSVNYSEFTIQELRKLASSYGIKGSFLMSKNELVRKLETI